MTSPVVIQTPGWGQEMQQGLAPLLQALQQRAVLKQNQEQLALERQRTEAQVAESQKRGEQISMEIKERQKALEEREKDLKAQQDGFAEYTKFLANGDPTDNAALATARAVIKDPQVMGYFDQHITNALAQRQNVATTVGKETDAAVTQAEAPARIAKAEFTTKAVNLARATLSPNAKFPKDPTMADAVVASYLGVLPVLTQAMEDARSTSGQSAQGLMLVRQMAVQAIQQATTNFNRDLSAVGLGGAIEYEKERKKRPELPSLDQLWDTHFQRAANAAGFDSGDQVKELVSTAIGEFLGRPATTRQAPAADAALQQFTEEEQARLMAGAEEIRKGATFPTIEDLRAAGFTKPALARSVLRRLVK